MAGFLAVGAGANEGLQEYLAQQLKQHLYEEGLQRDAEEVRSHKAEEGLRGRAIDEATAGRLAQQASLDASRASEAQNKIRDDLRTTEQMRPIGTSVDPAERARATDIALMPSSLYDAKGGLLADQTGNPNDQGPTLDLTYAGTEAQQENRLKIAKENKGTPSMTKEKGYFHGKLVDSTVDRHTGTRTFNGQEVPDTEWRPYEAPQQPILYQPPGETPSLINRGSHTATPVTDAQGNPLTPKQTSSEIDKADASQKLAGTLDRLDKSVDNAKDLIGPGMGRVGDFEQWVGNADPRLQTLGTNMLLAKMQADAAIGGMRAAASPQLLARWDSLLANKVSPENIKATIQVLREMTATPNRRGQGSSTAGTSSTAAPQGAADLIYDPATGTFKKP